MKTALLISHSGDFFTIDRVAEKLSEWNVKSIRFNTDLFPEEIKLNEYIGSTGYTIDVQTKEAQFNTSEIGAVWNRKVWTPIFKNTMNEQYLQASIRESVAVRTAFFQSLQHLPWLDHIPAVVEASDKYYQLRVAHSVGLKVPETLISNDEKAVRRFYKKLKTPMICKLHTALSNSMKGSTFSFYTTLIEEENLEDLDMLNVCPMIFQSFISKAYELRVAYVDGQCFAGKIQSGDVVDWRKPGFHFSWEDYTIPLPLQKKLIALMQKLNLSFGAIDLIAQPNGEYVFLEVNPVGEWGMLERDLDLPISEAIAKVLLKQMS